MFVDILERSQARDPSSTDVWAMIAEAVPNKTQQDIKLHALLYLHKLSMETNSFNRSLSSATTADPGTDSRAHSDMSDHDQATSPVPDAQRHRHPALSSRVRQKHSSDVGSSYGDEQGLVGSCGRLLPASKGCVWTPNEKRVFEEQLVLVSASMPDRWQRISEAIKTKTAEQVQGRYEDIREIIRCGPATGGTHPALSNFSKEGSNNGSNNSNGNGNGNNTTVANSGTRPLRRAAQGKGKSEQASIEWAQEMSGGGGSNSSKSSRRTSAAAAPSAAAQEPNGKGKVQSHGQSWSEEEHRRFLAGLEKFGKGDWRNIARQSVITRNPTQVASHAQKFFARQALLAKAGVGAMDQSNNMNRQSIHDITSSAVRSMIVSEVGQKGMTPQQGTFGAHQQHQQVNHHNHENDSHGSRSKNANDGGKMKQGGATSKGRHSRPPMLADVEREAKKSRGVDSNSYAEREREAQQVLLGGFVHDNSHKMEGGGGGGGGGEGEEGEGRGMRDENGQHGDAEYATEGTETPMGLGHIMHKPGLASGFMYHTNGAAAGGGMGPNIMQGSSSMIFTPTGGMGTSQTPNGSMSMGMGMGMGSIQTPTGGMAMFHPLPPLIQTPTGSNSMARGFSPGILDSFIAGSQHDVSKGLGNDLAPQHDMSNMHYPANKYQVSAEQT